MTAERKVQLFAWHLAMRLRKHRHGYVLHKRYGDRRRVSGVFRSIAGVKRGLERRLNDKRWCRQWVAADLTD